MKTNSPTSKNFLNEEEVLLINNKDLTIKRKISLTKEQQLNDIYNESINLNSLNNEEDSPEVQSKFHSKFTKQYNENYRNIFHPVHSYKTIDSSFRAILLDYKTDKRTKLKKILLCYRLIWFLSLKIVTNQFFDLFINGLIVFYCVSYTMKKTRFESLQSLDEICLYIFLGEYFLRYIAHGLFIKKKGLLHDNFHIYDLLIIILAVIYTFLLPEYNHYSLLIFRFLRIIKIIPFKHLILIFEGIFSCIIDLSQIYLFFLIFSFFFAFIGMALFSGILQNYCLNLKSGLFTDWNDVCGTFKSCSEGELCIRTLRNPDNNVTSFNDFHHAFLQVLRVITFDNWSSLLKNIRSSWNFGAYLYFIPLTIFGNFLAINLFLAVLKSEFEYFQKKKNIKDHKSLLVADFKDFPVSRTSSLSKINNYISFLQKNRGSISKYTVLSKLSLNQRIGTIEGILAENNERNNEGRAYRRFLMKLLHFEKYSKKFVTYFDKIHDFYFEVWEDYFSTPLINFPLQNIINFNVVQEFYSIGDVLPNKKIFEELHYIQRLEKEKKRKRVKVDLMKYFLQMKSKIKLKIKSKQFKPAIRIRKLSLFKVKTEDQKKHKMVKKYDKKKFSSVKNQRNYVKLSNSDLNLKNYDDLKLKINENMLKSLKETKKKDLKDKTDIINYYEIFEKEFQNNRITNNFWSGNDTIPKISELKKFQLIEQLYHETIKISDFWNLRDLFIHKFLRLISSPIYHFFIIFLNILNIFTITFGDYFLNDNLEAKILNICFILFFLDFIIKFLANVGFKNYIKDIYNIIDFFCLFSYALYRMVESLKFTDNFFKSVRFLFAVQPLRAFRFLQYLSFMETIHLVVLKTFSDFLPLALILFVFLYIFTLFGMQLFNKLSNDEQIPLNFQDFFSGFSTCFSILTLDNWYTFVSAFMNMTNRLSMTFFTLTLFLFGNFVLLDLFIAAMLHGFEFICFKQNQIEDNENNFNPESKQPNIWNKFAALHSQNFKEERKKESLFGHKVFASIKRVSKYISLFSVYWTVKHRKIVKLMKKVLKSKFFNYVLYVVIWISCGEMIIESYYINYWNYENEMTGFIFVLNLNLNIFFLLEIFIKIYTEGLIDGTKEIIKNFIYLNELMIIFGFFTYFLFDEKNLILQIMLILKYFRPLRLIKEHLYLRKVLDFFLQSIVGVFNVIPIILLVWFIFAILGVNLYKSRFGFCESQNEYLISKEECESNSRIWVINDFNFENIWNALLTLFVIATFDNWINILHIARNSDLPNKGPSFLNNSYSSYLYFFAFILISVLFLVNLFLGIMFVKFQMAERAGGKGSTHLNENQEKWVQMQSRILSIEPYKNHFSSAVGLKKKLISIMTSKQYSFIMSIIPLIVIILLMNENYNGLRKEIDQANKAKNIYSFSWSGYFSFKWNIIEFIIGIAYSVSSGYDIITGGSNFDYNFANFDRIFKILRVLVMFRLFHQFKFLRKMRHTITFKLPMIMHILYLFVLFLLIYALLAVYFFHDVDILKSTALDSKLNFTNVFLAMTTLFVCATGENWSQTLIDTIKYAPKCGVHNYLCGSYVSIIFFVSFMIFIHMILLNLLTLVIITQFETLHKNPLNPELIFVNNVDYFKKAWSKFSASHNNEKISRTKLPEFFRFLGAPLGIDRFDNFFDEAKKIMKMEIRCDLEGFVNFHSLLHATMKNFFNEKLGLENAHVDSLKKLEIYENHFHIAVLKKIKVNKTRIQAFKERFTFKEKENNFVSINPFKDYFNLLLCFLSMKKFAVIDNPKNLQNKNPINKSRFYQNSYSSEIDFFSKMSPSKLFEKTNSNLIANTSSKISKKN